MGIYVSTQNLVLCLSEAIDLISPSLSNHHRLVASIAWQFCEALNVPNEDKREIIYACALHDVGALTDLGDTNTTSLDFEGVHAHSQRGYLFFREFYPFKNIAEFIRYHHRPWNPAMPFDYENNKNWIASNIIMISDRIAVLINPARNILLQSTDVMEKILEMGTNYFAPELIEVFLHLGQREAFWLNSITYTLQEIFHRYIVDDMENQIYNYQLIKIFSRVIDFRSSFTATHSSGVAASAKALARMAGFSAEDQEKIEIAGFVHDLGKLAVPTEILEKNGALTQEEFAYIRTHTYYTNLILSRIEGFDDIRHWASQHHEKLDGTGYPFHLKDKELSIGSRIMAVSDVFVALCEDRPYRIGMQKERALKIIQNMADNSLDRDIIRLLVDDFEYINASRIEAQQSASFEYIQFEKNLVRVN